MPKVVHVVTTRRFAGVERYVADVAVETAAQGWEVTVVGGAPDSMRRALVGGADWLPGEKVGEALISIKRVGPADVLHAHMTTAEAVAVLARPFQRAPVVASRHFAAKRGKSRLGGVLGPMIARGLARQIAVSEFVAREIETTPDAVIPNAVRARPLLWRAGSRVVLVLQRLEAEKDTLTALRAWHQSGLAADGWRLRVVGDGSERSNLEAWVRAENVDAVEFAGWSEDPDSELAGAGIVLAPAVAEPAGVAVVEAMSAGVPVVAAAAGGHRETIGQVEGIPSFRPRDATEAASALRSLADESLRSELSRRVRAAAEARITLTEHVTRLIAEYERARR